MERWIPNNFTIINTIQLVYLERPVGNLSETI